MFILVASVHVVDRQQLQWFCLWFHGLVLVSMLYDVQYDVTAQYLKREHCTISSLVLRERGE